MSNTNDTHTPTLDQLAEKLGVTLSVAGGHYTTDKDGWAHVASQCTLRRDGKQMVTPFRQGISVAFPRIANRRDALAEMARQRLHGWARPTTADVLARLLSDASGTDQTFEGWCEDYGYDPDSRKALDCYLACQQIAQQLTRLFDKDELDQLAEAASQY